MRVCYIKFQNKLSVLYHATFSQWALHSIAYGPEKLLHNMGILFYQGLQEQLNIKDA